MERGILERLQLNCRLKVSYIHIFITYLCLYQGEIQDDIKAIFFVTACYRFLLPADIAFCTAVYNVCIGAMISILINSDPDKGSSISTDYYHLGDLSFIAFRTTL